MRTVLALAMVATLSVGQSKLDKRYGIEVDRENFPQSKPKETLESILKAIQMKKLDYVVAHLADPEFVDQRVKGVHGGKFESMVRETAAQLAEKPDTAKLFRRFIKEGKWEGGGEKDSAASAKLDGIKDSIYLRKIDERWFLENRTDKEKEKEKENK
jgi:hypothetical protein